MARGISVFKQFMTLQQPARNRKQNKIFVIYKTKKKVKKHSHSTRRVSVVDTGPRFDGEGNVAGSVVLTHRVPRSHMYSEKRGRWWLVGEVSGGG